MDKQIAVTVLLTIKDEQAFREAAHRQLLKQGCSKEGAAEYLGAGKTVEDCGVILVDPNRPPPGSEILDSSACDASVIH